MKKHYLPFIIISLFILSCAKKEDPFLVSKGQIGKLTKEINIGQLDSIYKKDSVVKVPGRSDFNRFGNDDKYLIFEKGGKHLLTVNPSSDSIQKPQNIRILDDRFQTAKGISLKSTFKDITDQYKISKVESTFNNVVVFVNEINAHFSISREELPSELRFNPTKKVEAVHIPDNAKIKYFMIGWD